MAEFDAMREGGLANLISASTFTNISIKNMEGSKNYDNIWISKHAKSNHFTGKSGNVVILRCEHQSNPKFKEKIILNYLFHVSLCLLVTVEKFVVTSRE